MHDAPQLPMISLELNGLGAYIARWISCLVCRRRASHRRHAPAVVSLLKHDPCQDQWRMETATQDPLSLVSAIERGDFPHGHFEKGHSAPSVGANRSQSAAWGGMEFAET